MKDAPTSRAINTATPLSTFRDPAGSLTLDGAFAVRRIHAASRESALAFVQSDFYQQAVRDGDMVSTEVEDTPDALVFRHPRIDIITYSWEWTPAQWLRAAELTLSLASKALQHGYIIKDATPLNIVFVGAKPVLVDVLSFDVWEPGNQIWLAYGQYARTFLLPLIARKLLHWPLELSLFRRDGYEPTELYNALNWRQRLSRAAFWPVTLPAMVEKRNPGAGTQAASQQRKQSPEVAKHVLDRQFAALAKRTRALLGSQANSEWSDYDATRSHYSSEESATKFEWVKRVLAELAPQHVLDIGANTGEFSALAASTGASVVALERDEAAADRLFNKTQSGQHILTIHADLSRPTPAVGWQNAEQTSLLSRLGSQFDMVFMLAVIHHLILIEQIPIPAIMDLARSLTTRHLILEWVPATDPMYISLMHGRDTLYGHLNETDLLAACEGRFTVRERQPLTNGRILFLLERA